MAISFSGFTPVTQLQQQAASAYQAQVEAEAKREEARRQAIAFNALRSQYGDAAGNPQAAVQLQNWLAAQQKLPGELEQQRLGNDQTRLQNDRFGQLTPGVVEQQSLTNATTRQALDQATQLQPSTVARAQQQVAAGQQTLATGQREAEDAGAEREYRALNGAVAALNEAIAKGEDPLAAFDRIVPQIAAMERINPDMVAQLRQRYAQNPRGFLDAMGTAANAARPNAAAQRLQVQREGLQIRRDALAARQAEQEAKRNPPPTEGGLAQIQAQGENAERVFDDMLGTGNRPGLVDRVSRSTPMRTLHGMIERGTGGGVSGDEVAYIQNIRNMTSTLGLDALARLKAAGVGLGSVTEAEHKLLQESVTQLNNARDPQEARRIMERVRHHYRRYQQALMSDLRRRPGGEEVFRRATEAQGTAPPPAGTLPGAPAPAAAPTPGQAPPATGGFTPDVQSLIDRWRRPPAAAPTAPTIPTMPQGFGGT